MELLYALRQLFRHPLLLCCPPLRRYLGPLGWPLQAAPAREPVLEMTFVLQTC
jgi:hypothetical protein